MNKSHHFELIKSHPDLTILISIKGIIMKKLILIMVAFCSQIAYVQATTFTLFSDASLIGRLPGADLVWNTPDDIVINGLNPNGIASFSYGSLVTDTYEYKTGSFELDGQVVIGANNVISSNTTTTSVTSGTVTTFTLAASPNSVVNVANNSTYTFSNAVDGSDGSNLVIVGDGQTIYNAVGLDDPNDVVGIVAIPGLVDFFNLVKLAVPNWTSISTDLAPFVPSYESGTVTWFYSTDPLAIPQTSAVPVPAAVWLFGSALMGLFGFSKKQKI